MEALSRYNGDVALGHYASAPRTCIGKQLRAVEGDRPNASPLDELVFEAISAKFFLARQIPLPLSALKASDFLRNFPPREIPLFWPKEPSAMDVLVRDAQPVERLWRSRIPAGIRPASGHINSADFHILMLSAQLRGSLGIRRIIFGFRLVGTLSQRYTYPLDTNLPTQATLAPSDLFSSFRSRFDARAKKEGRKLEGCPLGGSEWPTA